MNKAILKVTNDTMDIINKNKAEREKLEKEIEANKIEIENITVLMTNAIANENEGEYIKHLNRRRELEDMNTFKKGRIAALVPKSKKIDILKKANADIYEIQKKEYEKIQAELIKLLKKADELHLEYCENVGAGTDEIVRIANILGISREEAGISIDNTANLMLAKNVIEHILRDHRGRELAGIVQRL